MSKFPKIDGPCPYLDRLSQIMDGDHCRMCQRTVTDLTDMSDAARTRFLASCSGETCVTYRFPMKPAIAAAAIAAATLVAVPVAAQPAAKDRPPATAAPAPAAAAAAADEPEEETDVTEIYITGGRIARPYLYAPSAPTRVLSAPPTADELKAATTPAPKAPKPRPSKGS